MFLDLGYHTMCLMLHTSYCSGYQVSMPDKISGQALLSKSLCNQSLMVGAGRCNHSMVLPLHWVCWPDPRLAFLLLEELSNFYMYTGNDKASRHFNYVIWMPPYKRCPWSSVSNRTCIRTAFLLILWECSLKQPINRTESPLKGTCTLLRKVSSWPHSNRKYQKKCEFGHIHKPIYRFHLLGKLALALQPYHHMLFCMNTCIVVVRPKSVRVPVGEDLLLSNGRACFPESCCLNQVQDFFHGAGKLSDDQVVHRVFSFYFCFCVSVCFFISLSVWL